jgi:hypothetical protein
MLPILQHCRRLKTVRFGLGDPFLARLGDREARSRRGVNPLFYFVLGLDQPGLGCFLGGEGLDMALTALVDVGSSSFRTVTIMSQKFPAVKPFARGYAGVRHELAGQIRGQRQALVQRPGKSPSPLPVAIARPMFGRCGC